MAEILRIDPQEVAKLVNEGRLGAYRIGSALRFSENHMAEFLGQCEIAKPGNGSALNLEPDSHVTQPATEASGRKWCKTFGGQSEFPYEGSVATGTSIWPGKKVHFRLKFSAQQWSILLTAFGGRPPVRAGLNFARPEPGSMGEWIKLNWNTKMGPAAYVGGILIAEGYAERPRPGWIRFFDERRLV